MNDIWHEEWVVVVNDSEYRLDEKQALIAQEAIAKGLRGIIQFKDFAISIPFIEEFYLSKRWKEPKALLSEPQVNKGAAVERMEQEIKRLESEKHQYLAKPRTEEQIDSITRYYEIRAQNIKERIAELKK